MVSKLSDCVFLAAPRRARSLPHRARRCERPGRAEGRPSSSRTRGQAPRPFAVPPWGVLGGGLLDQRSDASGGRARPAIEPGGRTAATRPIPDAAKTGFAFCFSFDAPRSRVGMIGRVEPGGVRTPLLADLEFPRHPDRRGDRRRPCLGRRPLRPTIWPRTLSAAHRSAHRQRRRLQNALPPIIEASTVEPRHLAIQALQTQPSKNACRRLAVRPWLAERARLGAHCEGDGGDLAKRRRPRRPDRPDPGSCVPGVRALQDIAARPGVADGGARFVASVRTAVAVSAAALVQQRVILTQPL